MHCGFCTATCPTYVLDGNELDSPRGRIYLIKDMLENDRAATAEVARHIDRCLSCLACMTTCPSGVHYMHLVDHARAHIESTYRRPLAERLLRTVLAKVMPYPQRFWLALHAALLAKPLAPLAAAIGLQRIAAMLRLSPWRRPHRPLAAQIFPAPRVAEAGPRGLAGRLRQRHPGAGNQRRRDPRAHASRRRSRAGRRARAAAARSSTTWAAKRRRSPRRAPISTPGPRSSGLDAIVITASGCGTTVKDYGFMLRTDSAYAERAARVAKPRPRYQRISRRRCRSRPSRQIAALVVAYHAACSLQHGQRITRQPKELLAKLGFSVKDVPEGHLCCGSAGTYNILQPDIARRLRERKVGTIERLRPDVIAAGNIGCITQIAAGTELPVVHTVELIDWATGGPCPPALREHRPACGDAPVRGREAEQGARSAFVA